MKKLLYYILSEECLTIFQKYFQDGRGNLAA